MLALPLALVAALAAAPSAPAAKAPAPIAKPADGLVIRGEALSGKTPKLAFAEVVKKPDAFSGKTATVEGVVRQVCSRKGCWMELSDSAQGKTGARVTFKDYGFFVPTDCQGAKATVEGTIEMAAISEEDAQHLESEGATIPRKDGKPQELRIVASGVELRK